MYERLISLIGQDKFDIMQNAKVLIVGIGGVGGYSLEAITRSVIKHITIIDGDNVEISNLNRQIISNQNNINTPKVDVAKERILSIHPDANITTYNYRLDKSNVDDILRSDFDYIIDACDDIDAKLLLIEKSLKYRYKLISSMGTANKFNPNLFEITELSKTNNDPIARILRKKVKELKINKKIWVVSSTETPKDNGNVLGTNSYIPGMAGLMCASYVINDIIKSD